MAVKKSHTCFRSPLPYFAVNYINSASLVSSQLQAAIWQVSLIFYFIYSRSYRFYCCLRPDWFGRARRPHPKGINRHANEPRTALFWRNKQSGYWEDWCHFAGAAGKTRGYTPRYVGVTRGHLHRTGGKALYCICRVWNGLIVVSVRNLHAVATCSWLLTAKLVYKLRKFVSAQIRKVFGHKFILHAFKRSALVISILKIPV